MSDAIKTDAAATEGCAAVTDSAVPVVKGQCSGALMHYRGKRGRRGNKTPVYRNNCKCAPACKICGYGPHMAIHLGKPGVGNYHDYLPSAAGQTRPERSEGRCL